MVTKGMKYKYTTVDYSHRHRWYPLRKFTTNDRGHNHKINLRKMLALPGGRDGHTHRLLKR